MSNQARFAPANQLDGLGLLAKLAGKWKGRGYNLIARPNFADKTDLYLQLNHTTETLSFDPIGSVVPNRGFGQGDIQLHGLTYLQKVHDAGHDGALHIEPGIWITQEATTFPVDSVPPPAQLIARMSTIPHGNSVLAEGVAEPFTGTPVLKVPGGEFYEFSKFPSFNSTPFGVPPTAAEGIICYTGTSDAGFAPTVGAVPFPQYDLSIPPAPTPLPPELQAIFNLNTRTPYQTLPPEPPIENTPENQAALINDPIQLLEDDIQKLVDDGYTFEGVVLNVATRTPIKFTSGPNFSTEEPLITVDVPQFANGGTENIKFLAGANVDVGGNPEPVANAQTALVYATFWISTVENKQTGHKFEQLNYAQMVVLEFPVFHLMNPPVGTPQAFVNLGWPHISVATLKKTFG